MAQPLDPWMTDARDFPADGDAADKLRFLVNYAVLAPSGHNTQPWLFRIRNDMLEVRADRTRRLPVVDPTDRALVISCGAALCALMVALRRFGYAGAVSLLPDAGDPDLLARVDLGERIAAGPEDLALFAAIRLRRTTRRRFEPRPLPSDLIEACRAAATQHGVELRMVTDEAGRHAVATLIAEGDRAQFADPEFRRELAAWVRSRRGSGHDGISGAAFGMPDILSPAGAAAIRLFDMGENIANTDRAIAEGSPALALFATPDDRPADWLAAGQALMRVLLLTTAADVKAAFLNQPVEVPALRPRLCEVAGLSGVPQLLIRLGYGPVVDPAARRPAAAVIMD